MFRCCVFIATMAAILFGGLAFAFENRLAAEAARLENPS